MLKSSLRYSIYKVQTRFPKKAFELYHTQFRLSRTFFEFFQTFSRRFSLVLAFASNSVILSHLFKLVKHFFRAFPKFSSCEVAFQASAFHHTTFSLYLNKFHLSRTFFSFFQISLVFGIISLPSRTACVYYHMLSHLSSIF